MDERKKLEGCRAGGRAMIQGDRGSRGSKDGEGWRQIARKNVVIVMWHCIFSHVEFRLFTWTKTNFNYEIWKVKEKKLVSFKFLNILLTNTISDQRTGIRIKSCSGKERDYNIS